MKTKLLLLLSFFFLSFSSFSSFDKEDVLKVIKGKYILQTNFSGEIHFVIRSSGKLQVVKTDWYDGDANEQFPATISIEGGDNGMLRGLPVAHLLFSEGSDEQAIDFHLLLTASQYWGNEGAEVRLLSSFSLENDGPNETANIIQTKLTLLKYNKKTKKYVIVK
ncbi:hypothetical protein A9Q84_03365 [Halobacteriovorax marinus]|uniref:Secreted protein n=1 Tax=Halobacteriovorax marinus TaxID=97084 RepID=A0A1Y5FFJ2_9BACT|nr:hypothetical protein A9Q84_03365 [Halobacteriovorax marinus]